MTIPVKTLLPARTQAQQALPQFHAEPIQYAFAALCLATVSLGVAFQILSTNLIRAGTPREEHITTTASQGDTYFDIEMGVFERELLVDAGNAVGRIANLLVYASVVASLAIAFPNLAPAGVVVFVLSLLPALYSMRSNLGQMVAKRSRQQNLFDLISPNGLGPPGYTMREYWLDRHPSLDSWRSLSRLRRSFSLIAQIVYTARWYWPREAHPEML